MDKALAARRLSAALGRKVAPERITYVFDSGMVVLDDDTVYTLAAGNACYAGGGVWYRNGKTWRIGRGDVIKSL